MDYESDSLPRSVQYLIGIRFSLQSVQYCETSLCIVCAQIHNRSTFTSGMRPPLLLSLPLYCSSMFNATLLVHNRIRYVEVTNRISIVRAPSSARARCSAYPLLKGSHEITEPCSNTTYALCILRNLSP